jgi:hypothetical protein
VGLQDAGEFELELGRGRVGDGHGGDVDLGIVDTILGDVGEANVDSVGCINSVSRVDMWRRTYKQRVETSVMMMVIIT